MKKFIAPIIIVLAFLLLLIISGTFYTVQEGEQVIVVQLGKPVGTPVTQAGLHVKLPILQNLYRFDKRILPWDGDPERIPTKDNKFIFVDTYARWHITNALRFYQTVVNEAGAQTRLDDVLDGNVRDIISRYPLTEIVRTTKNTSQNDSQESSLGNRLEITRQVFERSRKTIHDQNLGIDLVDFQIKRIDYTQQVRGKVYDRMISEQLQIAEKYRAQGKGRKAEIEGTVTKERKTILSEAYRKSQEIRGKADAKSTTIYARAYNRDPEFYSFVKSLETYEKTMKGKDTLILTTKSDLYRYLKKVK